MIDKLQKLEVPAALVHWVFNFLSNRPQCVRVGDIKSPVLVSNTGAPQGCVLSPFFTPCIQMTVVVSIHLPNL